MDHFVLFVQQSLKLKQKVSGRIGENRGESGSWFHISLLPGKNDNWESGRIGENRGNGPSSGENRGESGKIQKTRMTSQKLETRMQNCENTCLPNNVESQPKDASWYPELLKHANNHILVKICTISQYSYNTCGNHQDHAFSWFLLWNQLQTQKHAGLYENVCWNGLGILRTSRVFALSHLPMHTTTNAQLNSHTTTNTTHPDRPAVLCQAWLIWPDPAIFQKTIEQLSNNWCHCLLESVVSCT